MIRFAFLLSLAVSVGATAEDQTFIPLFNGRDLSGWVNVNCAPETWSVREGMIHCTGKPTGALRTERQYENYILELDWRHLSVGGNSGVFIWASPIAAPGVPFLRAIEVQVLDNGYDAGGKNEWFTTHGDVFPIHGSSMQPFGRHNGMRSFPSAEGSKSSPEWNHYRVMCTNGVIRLSVNGKEVSGGAQCNYRKGYLGLESEGGPIDFRNIRIAELPPSGAPADQSAPLDAGWRPLFTGLDFRGWQTNAASASRWGIANEMLAVRPGAADPAAILWGAPEFGDVEIVVDCRVARPVGGGVSEFPAVRVRADELVPLVMETEQTAKYHRFMISVKGQDLKVFRDGQQLEKRTLSAGIRSRGRFGLVPGTAAVEFMNLYARDL